MFGMDRFSVWGSAGLLAGTVVLTLVGFVSLLLGGSPEELLSGLPAGPGLGRSGDADDLIRQGESGDGDEAGAGENGTEGPASEPSETPEAGETPGTAVLAAGETPAPQVAVFGPPPPPGATPAPGATATPTPAPEPGTPTPPPPTETCSNGGDDSGIKSDEGEIKVERGSVVSFSGVLLVLSTADGPIELIISEETEVRGDLTLATQVRAEGVLLEVGGVLATRVEVLCPDSAR